MSDLNRVIIVGRLTKDSELRHTQAGMSVASFTIANNRTHVAGGEKKEQVSFFNCVAWGKLGETISQYCKKGQRIGIDGRIQQRSWEGQDGAKRITVEIVVENVQFLSPKSESNGNPQADKIKTILAPASPDDAQGAPFSDDDIPF